MGMFMSNPGNVPDMTLDKVREEISEVDSRIIRLIAQRQKLAGKIAQIKVAHSLPIHDRNRSADVLESAFEQAVECRIDPVSVQKIFEILIAMSEERQRECSGDGNLP
jgi:chorismate mutase